MEKKHLNIFMYMLTILVGACFFEVIFSFVYLVFYTYIKLYSVEFVFLTLYDNAPMIIIFSFILIMLDYLIIKITYWFNRKYYVSFPSIAKVFGYFVFSGFTLYKLLATILDIKVNSVTLISSVVLLILIFIVNDSSFNQFIDNYDMDIDVTILPGKIVGSEKPTYTAEQIQAMNARNIENSGNVNNNNDLNQ